MNIVITTTFFGLRVEQCPFTVSAANVLDRRTYRINVITMITIMLTIIIVVKNHCCHLGDIFMPECWTGIVTML